jgi:cyclopropane-fatty-acyl-phospholipid synthase
MSPATGFADSKIRAASLPKATASDLFAYADIQIDGDRAWDIQVKDDRFYARVLSEGTLGLGESYMDGWWECDGLDEMCFRAVRAQIGKRIRLNLESMLSVTSSIVFNLQTQRRARRVGLRHYDLGNDFFEAMLGRSMQYSCAYFRGTSELAEAQSLKLDLICRKLGLEEGMRLLDIGCGWGGLAKFAAQQYGCHVVGITISQQQYEYAASACRGLPVEIRLQDYREVSDSFDRIVSVGMMEHVGYKNYRRYLAAAHGCLKKDGLFLCHSIVGLESITYSDPWITRYIFPNSMLPSVVQVTKAAEGLFVLEDAHNFGADYDKTLMAWDENFAESWHLFQESYGERFFRMWRFYLLSCAGAFRARHLQLFQFVLSKEGVLGGYTAVR